MLLAECALPSTLSPWLVSHWCWHESQPPYDNILAVTLRLVIWYVGQTMGTDECLKGSSVWVCVCVCRCVYEWLCIPGCVFHVCIKVTATTNVRTLWKNYYYSKNGCWGKRKSNFTTEWWNLPWHGLCLLWKVYPICHQKRGHQSIRDDENNNYACSHIAEDITKCSSHMWSTRFDLFFILSFQDFICG